MDSGRSHTHIHKERRHRPSPPSVCARRPASRISAKCGIKPSRIGLPSVRGRRPPSVITVCLRSPSRQPCQRLPPIMGGKRAPSILNAPRTRCAYRRHRHYTTTPLIRSADHPSMELGRPSPQSVLPHYRRQSVCRGHRPSMPSVYARCRSRRVSAYLL